MSIESPIHTSTGREDGISRALERLQELRAYRGASAQFWPQFLQIALGLVSGSDGVVLTRSRAPEESGAWRENACWPPSSLLMATLKANRGIFERLGMGAEGDGASAAPELRLAAVRLDTGDTQRSSILAVLLEPGLELDEAITRLRLLADVPLLYQATRALDQARHDVGRFGVVLDLMVLVNAQTRFLGAAMVLCNELAARFRCERVGLGWLERGYIRLQALSHTEKFERKMAVAIALEAAMDEALDQDEEIAWPPQPESTAVTRDHEAYSRAHSVDRILSVPIRLEGNAVGVLTLERAAVPEFTTQEVQSIRLLCDHVARRLHDLKHHDRWIGARFASWLRVRAAELVGPEHTVAKVACIAGAIVLGILCFGKTEYRVEAHFALKTDALAQLPAPFDGFLDEVHFRVGDPVRAGQPLLTLDTREMLLQEAAAAADQQRYLAEAQQAESTERLAEMRIAHAAADEAKARLDLARYHLEQAKVAAPFDGFVVEGDLRDRLSAPVKQGEVLVKVAKIEAMYAEATVSERDVHEIHAGQTGEIAFAGRPQLTFPVRIERVEPIAQVRENGGNIFITRAEVTGAPQPWWRPGMSGVCKVNAGKRTFGWIFAHRTIDFLRLYFWW